MGLIDQWLDEKYREGIDEGINQGAREVVLSLLVNKFGHVPDNITERIQRANAEWCRNITESVLRARTLEDLDLS